MPPSTSAPRGNGIPSGPASTPSPTEPGAAPAGSTASTTPEASAPALVHETVAGAPPARRGRDPLLAGICHDLRAPLAAVTMGANFVLQTTPEDESTSRSRRVLSAVLRSCKQMERLIRDFGDLSEIEGDAVELRTGLYDVRELLEITAQTARPNALLRKIEVTTSCPETPVLIQCDRDRLLRALGHVIDNAVRFSPEEGTVVLAASESGNGAGRVRFSVTDRGVGISAETMEHLYDRTWHSKRPGRTGAGLGLAIARGIVRAHGGEIEVDTKVGGPTTVTLALPKDGVTPSAER